MDTLRLEEPLEDFGEWAAGFTQARRPTRQARRMPAAARRYAE